MVFFTLKTTNQWWKLVCSFSCRYHASYGNHLIGFAFSDSKRTIWCHKSITFYYYSLSVRCSRYAWIGWACVSSSSHSKRKLLTSYGYLWLLVCLWGERVQMRWLSLRSMLSHVGNGQTYCRFYSAGVRVRKKMTERCSIFSNWSKF